MNWKPTASATTAQPWENVSAASCVPSGWTIHALLPNTPGVTAPEPSWSTPTSCHGSLTLFLGTHALAKVWDATAQARAMNSGSRPSGRSACPIGLGTPHYLRPHVPLALIGDHEPDARREGVEGKLSQ